ncbi:MAG: DUF3131 domain-containing protein [Alphaproteobacteria bacterium]
MDGYPSTTFWDTASYIAGLVSARELGIIQYSSFFKYQRDYLRSFVR